MLSTVVMEWSMLVVGFFGCVDTDVFAKVPIDVDMLIQGLFAAATVMISFGALIGKAAPNQLLFIAIVEVVAYAANSYLFSNVIMGIDAGGSLRIHAFGAYFGLAASVYITPPLSSLDRSNFKEMESTYTSDLFAFIGTVFLWVYWPSFVAATGASEIYQERAVVNTVLALLSSCVITFYISPLMNKRMFDAVDIQNASLAGGVAIGAAACFSLEPFGAIVVGGLAGAISCIGYHYLLRRIEKFGAHDTCGVHNLHGMPGILGGFVSVLMTGIAHVGHTNSSLRLVVLFHRCLCVHWVTLGVFRSPTLFFWPPMVSSA